MEDIVKNFSYFLIATMITVYLFNDGFMCSAIIGVMVGLAIYKEFGIDMPKHGASYLASAIKDIVVRLAGIIVGYISMINLIK